MESAGHARQRPDLPAVVTGRLEFVHNVSCRGCCMGAWCVPGGGRDAGSRGRESVTGYAGRGEVVARQNFVGVVAEKPCQATQAAQQI